MLTDTAKQAASRRIRGHFKRLASAPQFAAVIDCFFDLQPRRTRPAFAELCLIDGRLVFARAQGEETFRHFVGRRDQLAINLVGLVTHLRLGADEHEYVLSKIDAIPLRTAR